MSKDSEEVWYQAALELNSCDGWHTSTSIVALGPPRKLLDDVRIDIARNGALTAREFDGNPMWEAGKTGATILWPLNRFGNWVRVESKTPAEA